jgi:hypothetical protein
MDTLVQLARMVLTGTLVQLDTLVHRASLALLVDTLVHKAQSDILVQLVRMAPPVDIQEVLARMARPDTLVHRASPAL